MKSTLPNNAKQAQISAAVGGNTGMTSVLPGFSKIECGGGRAAMLWWSYLARAEPPLQIFDPASQRESTTGLFKKDFGCVQNIQNSLKLCRLS